MKKINKFGIWAFALVALADLFPQTAAAAGSIRSIRAVESFLDAGTGNIIDLPDDDPANPAYNYRERKTGDVLAFRVRLLNYNPDLNPGSQMDNIWRFELKESILSIPDLADFVTNTPAFLPRLAIDVGGREDYAIVDLSMCKRASNSRNHTDLVFKYTVKPGDMAAPIRLKMRADNSYDLGLVDTLSSSSAANYWRLRDSSTDSTNLCSFVWGKQTLVPDDITDHYEYYPDDYYAVQPNELHDERLDAGGNFYLWTVNFDADQDPDNGFWRKVEAGSTTIVGNGSRPTLSIDGVVGGNNGSTYYLWTTNSDIAYVKGGVDVYAKDVNGQWKTFKVYSGVVPAGATSIQFDIQGVSAGTNVIYLSSSPTNIWNGAGTLINNFVTKTIFVEKPRNEFSVTVVDSPTDEAEHKGSIDCSYPPECEAPGAYLKVRVPKSTKTLTVSLNPTIGGVVMPSGVLGISKLDSGSYLSYETNLVFAPQSAMTNFYYRLYGLGCTNSSLTVNFNPTISGDDGEFEGIAPFTLDVHEIKPALSGLPASLENDDVTAGKGKAITIYIKDSYANLTDPDGYEVEWTDDRVTKGGTLTSDSLWTSLASNVKPVRTSDGRYKMELTLNYTSEGNFDTYIRVRGRDGLESRYEEETNNPFPVIVKGAQWCELVTDHDANPELKRKYYENEYADPVNVSFYLRNWGSDNKNRTGSPLYVFLVPQGNTANYISQAEFITTTPNASSSIVIEKGATNSTVDVEEDARFFVLDGVKGDSKKLDFWVVLSKKDKWFDVTNGFATVEEALANESTVVFVQKTGNIITALNVEPQFDSVKMSGAKALRPTDATKEWESDQGLMKTFTWAITDVTADRSTIKSRWTVTYPDGNPDPAVDGLVMVGDPATTNLQYCFQESGTYVMKLEIQDKDMADQDWVPFEFTVKVGNEPRPVFALADGTEIENEGEHYLDETAKGNDALLYVGLSSPADDPVVIKVTRTPASSTSAGTFDFEGAEADGAVYVRIPARSKGARTRIRLAALDGTRISEDDGFTVTATVTNTNLNADGMPYNEVYKPAEFTAYVRNIDPVLKVYPEPGSKSSTNEYEYAATVTANETLQIEWEAEDVPADMADNMELKWSGLPSDATYIAGSSTSPTGVMQFYFIKGSHTVTLFVKDKDKGTSATYTFVYTIRPSKDAYITPLGPSRNGQSQTSRDYLSANGKGKGRVYVEGAEKCTAVRNFRQSWASTEDTPEIFAWAFGYRVGDVDNGSLPMYDQQIDHLGNYLGNPITRFYPYDDREKDSFFYAWIYNVSDDQGGTTGTAYANPQIGTNDYKSMKFDLPTETLGDESAPYYQSLNLEAVFAREWRPADNVGDINADGIPDTYAVAKKWDAGYLYQQTEGGGGGGEGEGAIGGGDLKDLDGLNTDEDFLPAPTSGGDVLIPNVASWATTGAKFSAYYEIRGFGDGLNYRDGVESGSKNYDVRGTWISEPDFTPAETNAYLRYCATKISTSDPAVVALAEAACTAAGEDPTDPDQLKPYLDPALAEYAQSDAFKAAVFQPDYLATVDWSPENRTDPTKADTDEDGLPDGYEYFFWYRALVGDDDGVQMVGSRFNPDNIAQGIDITPEEIMAAFNPTVKSKSVEQHDTDEDGLTDLEELAIGTNPVHWDTDGDGMSDLYEVMWGLNPIKTLVEQSADKNPDGDFMASWTSDETWAVVTVPNKGIYAIDESATILNGFVEGGKKNEGTLDTSAGDVTLQGIPVFWYGADGTTPVPKNRFGPLTNLVEFVAPADETVTVLRGKALRLIHDQVYNSFAFDPRTGWYSNSKGACGSRWESTSGAEAGVGDGPAGMATNTVAFTSVDEYLLAKYRKETGAPGASGTQVTAWATGWMVDHANVRRAVAELLWQYCTCPNLPFPNETHNGIYGSSDSESGSTQISFASTVYGADTDGDGVPDGWELYVGANPNNGSDGSQMGDADTLSLVEEYAGTDSCNAYSNTPSIYANHPGNNSGWYNKFFPTDPKDPDTDGDSVIDSDEGKAWKGAFYNGRSGGDTESMSVKFSFIYGPRSVEGSDNGAPEADNGSRCVRGGGLNPCTVDTDLDLLPDGWERQFAGLVFNAEGQPDPNLNSPPDNIIKRLRFSDGLDSATGETLATPTGYYISGGMDGTYGPASGGPGDADTVFNEKAETRDPRTGTRRDCDWDHDGLENFQEYLVQTLRHLRYDDSETPLMGSQIADGALRFVKCLPFQAFDGTAFYETCRMNGFQATSAWKYRELGYFARPLHEWDRVALNTIGNEACKNYEDYEGVGYRILLPPQGLSFETTPLQEKRFENKNYVSTDPRRWDTDDDGMDDYWELFHGLNPLLGSAEQMGMGDVIALQYGGIPNAWVNAWTGWPLLMPFQPPFDAMRYPWMIGTPECDADGDGIRNAEEGLFVNITTPSPKHTDPTPLWMTDKTSPTCASFTSQYYRMDPYMDADDMGMADIFQYPTWGWSSGDGVGASEGQIANYMFSFEENEGYDTDGDRRSDSNESVKMVENASDPLVFSDPNRRQTLYLPGWHTSALTGEEIGSAVVSRGGSDTLQKPLSSCYDLLRQFTVEAWVRPEKLGVEQVILERVANYGPSTLSNNTPVIRANFRLGITADDKYFAEFEGNTADSGVQRLIGTMASTNDWTHLACTFDGSTFALYVNDEEAPVVKSENISVIPANGIVIIRQEAGAATPVQNRGYTAAPCAFIIGARAVTGDAIVLSKDTTWDAYGDYFTGWIDEVRVWDGARTGAEIAADSQKRYSFADVKNLRQTIYQSWVAGATRNNVVGKVLPAELLQHYDFSTLPGAIDSGAVALEPLQFTKNVLDNVRIDGVDESALGAGGLNVGWWWMLSVHSDVYSDFHTVPWVQNTCAHLPFMDGSTPDSMYWCENFGGLTPASAAYAFPNTANPYSFYNYLFDRAAHLKRLQRFAEGANSPYAAFENLYTFQLRSGFVGTSDLVPLGGAFAKRTSEMWDGLAADAWTQTEDDSDADGLPNWWEAFVAAGGNADFAYVGEDGNPLPSEDITWSAMVWRNGVKMTLAQAYLRDLADGMVHDWDADTVSIDSAYIAKVDENKNGIPDWWEKLYDIYGEDAVADHDNDQLSNYAEYLIGECFTRVNGVNRKEGYDAAKDIFKTLDPTSMFSYRDEGQVVPDYFRRIGSLYLGELFTDYDFMEDWWERYINNPEYVSRDVFDAFKDADADGWSNFAECRHSLWKALTTSDLIDKWLDDGLAHVSCRPDPIVGVKVAYYGNKDVSGATLIVNVSPNNIKIRDAVFAMPGAGATAQTASAYIGPYRSNAVLHGHMNPGSIMAGSSENCKFYRVTLSSDVKYVWSYDWYRDNANVSLSYGVAGSNRGIGTMAEYLSESAKYPHIELIDTTLAWELFATGSPAAPGSTVGNIIYALSSTTNGTTTATSGSIGTINYRTGEFEIDMAKLAAAEGSTAELEASVFKVDYSYRRGVEWPQTVYLSQPVSGYVREGRNVVSAFLDLDGDGKWTAGEPYGVAPAVDVGWWKTTTEIELTDTHPSMARFDLSSALGGSSSSGSGSSSSSSSGSESSAAVTDRSANGYLGSDMTVTNAISSVPPLNALRLRVVRDGFNDGNYLNTEDTFREVVLDRTINASLKTAFTEADLMAEGLFDLDWGTVFSAFSSSRVGSTSKIDLRNVTYRVFVGNGTIYSPDDDTDVLPVKFVNVFEPLAYQTPTTPLTPQGTIDSGRPTFTWRHNQTVKDYPAFQLKVWKADGTTLVYDSGVRKAPPRSATGVYSWTAPLYANMVTAQGQVFATTNNYQWAVSMLDAKFPDFRERGGGETKQTFRLECSGVSGGISDYGTIALKVKYFGPGVVSAAATSSLTNLIRVQAFDTPDFTGEPAGEAYVADVSDLSSTTNLAINARIIGLAPGTYYVRAFIDSTGDGAYQAGESWGYANYVGTEQSAVYNPKGLKIDGGSMNVPEAVIYIEDADTDADGFPDIYEWNQKGNLTTIGPATGDTFFTQVNPDLQNVLSAYANLRLDTGKAMAVQSAPVFRLMRAAASPEGLNAVNALLSSTPAVEVESGIAVTIESFSLEDGMSVKVETATAVDSQGLLAIRAEPVSFRLELRHKATLAEAGWETVASVPFAVGANETVTLSADDLAVLREKITEIQTTGQSGFFKVVLTK